MRGNLRANYLLVFGGVAGKHSLEGIRARYLGLRSLFGESARLRPPLYDYI
jgi:hypothetical protein